MMAKSGMASRFFASSGTAFFFCRKRSRYTPSTTYAMPTAVIHGHAGEAAAVSAKSSDGSSCTAAVG